MCACPYAMSVALALVKRGWGRMARAAPTTPQRPLLMEPSPPRPDFEFEGALPATLLPVPAPCPSQNMKQHPILKHRPTPCASPAGRLPRVVHRPAPPGWNPHRRASLRRRQVHLDIRAPDGGRGDLDNLRRDRLAATRRHLGRSGGDDAVQDRRPNLQLRLIASGRLLAPLRRVILDQLQVARVQHTVADVKVLAHPRPRAVLRQALL